MSRANSTHDHRVGKPVYPDRLLAPAEKEEAQKHFDEFVLLGPTGRTEKAGNTLLAQLVQARKMTDGGPVGMATMFDENVNIDVDRGQSLCDY
jgi:hypothetical protein